MRWERMLKDKKGVSPVIGVILMVAITVILAAVIASFVFGMGTKVKAAPEAQLILSDHEDQISTGGYRDYLVYITHMGGDALKCDELKVKVTNLDKRSSGTKTYVLTWRGSNYGYFADDREYLRLYVREGVGYGDKYYIAKTGLLEPGDTATLMEHNDARFVDQIPARLEIQIIHMPTNTIIYTGIVTVT